jgi:hypothetical protein
MSGKCRLFFYCYLVNWQVFGLLDANKDGAVDEREFSAGMKLFR